MKIIPELQASAGRLLLRLGVAIPFVLLFALRALGETPKRSSAPSRIALKPCQLPNVDGVARCGIYDVYENRNARAGRKIGLNIVVLPALESSHAPDPVFWLHGGPGAAATQTVAAAKGGFLEVFRKDRDLVFVDQRGTGKSNGLRCDLGDDPANLQIYFGRLFPADAIRACRERLKKTADLRLYTTPIAMDDLDEVRKALGYNKINIVAASYGTIAAQAYMRQHPASIRAVLLVGVATPGVKQPLLFSPAAQHALDLLFVDCAADQLCNRAFPNLKNEFDVVLSRFDQGPFEVTMLDSITKKTQAIRLERENFVERIRLLLYTTTFASFVPLVVHKAYEGDFVPFEAISIAYNPGSLLSRGMYLTVSCSEGIPFITDSEIIDESQGTFVGEARVRAHIEACRLWPRGNVSRSFIDPVKSTLPVLMFSGELDGSTPPWFGKRAIEYLPNGQQITARYYGHQLDSPCLWAVMRDFIQSASARGVDTACVEEIRRPPFATDIPAAFSL
jgi:pimeloyl-ACP methyl ester carboxylesterase